MPGRRCGVAVGVLTAACRYVDGAAEVAAAVQQSDDNVCAVELGVDVERQQGAVAACRVVVP